MDVPEGNISAKNITAENLNIELSGVLDTHQQVSTGGLIAPGTTPKLKIYNQATLPQKNSILASSGPFNTVSNILRCHSAFLHRVCDTAV